MSNTHKKRPAHSCGQSFFIYCESVRLESILQTDLSAPAAVVVAI